jgi:hypothetical protein
MASNEVTISSLFSQLKQFSWFFTINCNPTSLTCVSTSEEVARRSIINFIAKIDELTKDYRIAKEKQDWAKVKEFQESFNYNEIGANLNIGCFCTPIYDFHLDMEITDHCFEEKTLAAFLITAKPSVKPFYPVSIFSCLDG